MSRSVAFSVVSIAAGLALAAILSEAALAVLKINTTSYSRFILDVGGAYVSGAYYRHTKEGFSEGYFNSHGFRDYERTWEKPVESYRILVFGDSYVEALQVPLEASFTSILEDRLGDGYEVLNLGQSGFGTADEYHRYLYFGTRYDPDLVILAFLTGNDFQNNSRILNAEAVANYYTLDESGHLVRDDSLLQAYEESLTIPVRVFKWIKARSYLANLISERLFLLRRELRVNQIEETLAADHSQERQTKPGELDRINIYLENPSERWQEAFEVTKALIRKFRDTVEANGSRFLLVTLSNAIQLDKQGRRDLVAQYGEIFDWERPDRMIREFAESEKIDHLELLPVFRERRERDGLPLHGWSDRDIGHWNERGHRLAAEHIFRSIMGARAEAN